MTKFPKYSEEIAALFKPRPKLRFIKPEPKRPPRPYTGMACYLREVQKYKREEDSSPPFLPINESRKRRREERIAKNNLKIQAQLENYHPLENPNATSNPKTTLFICNIPEDVTEQEIRFELEPFGKVKGIKFPVDIITGKRKNYCFAEYENEDSFKTARIHATKIYFNGRKPIVDLEKGRTVPNWLPRRLGGGIGAESRRFLASTKVLKCQHCRKRSKNASYRFGKKYRGTMREAQRKRDELIGLSLENVRKERKLSRMARRNE